MSLKLPGLPAAAVFISREQGDADGWSTLAIIPPSLSSNSSLGWTGAIQTNGWTEDSGTQDSIHAWGWMVTWEEAPVPFACFSVEYTVACLPFPSQQWRVDTSPKISTHFSLQSSLSESVFTWWKWSLQISLKVWTYETEHNQCKPFQHKVHWIFIWHC